MPQKTRELRAAYKRKLMRRRKDKWISENGPCRQCGSSDNLEVDHVDPGVKSFAIHWGIRQDVLILELMKCQVLCEKCHLKRTIEQKTKEISQIKGSISAQARLGIVTEGIPHGCVNSYRYHRCRCEKCRASVAEYQRSRRNLPVVRNATRAYHRRIFPTVANNYKMSIPIAQIPEPHGTKQAYKVRGCRCHECMAWHEEDLQSLRETAAIERACRPPKPPKPEPIIRHGSQRAYGHHHCRCEVCMDGQRQRTKDAWEKKKRVRGPVPPKEKAPMVHGTYYCYCHHACRCDSCKDAAQIYRDTKKASTVSHAGL